MSTIKKILIPVCVILGLIMLCYLGGILAQLITNYNEWLSAGGMTGEATMPAVNWDFIAAIRNSFTPAGLKGIAGILVAGSAVFAYIKLHDKFDNKEYEKEITAELHETEPELTIEDLKENVKLISSYKTNFESSNLNRRRNIQKAAEIINGCVVSPWQEISFNEYVGPRTEAGGWLPAPGITGGPGGGICQVSGTLYNALLACGPNRINVTKRAHHTWPSTYLPYGLDATVDTNGPDLCWKNVSDENIYIFAYADTTEGQRNMYVYIFGKPEEDGSYYETDAETISEEEPEPTEYVDNSGWPTGYSEVLISPRKGYVAVAYLLHYDANGELIEKITVHTDYYKAVRGKIMRGTGPSSLPKP